VEALSGEQSIEGKNCPGSWTMSLS